MAAAASGSSESMQTDDNHSVNFTDEMADKPGVSFQSNPQDRAVLKMMTAIRSTLSCVGKIFSTGKHEMCKKLLNNAIQNAIRDRKVTRMPQHLLEVLEEGKTKCESCSDQADAVWHLRNALDAVYDEYVDMYCGVNNPRFNPVHKSIGNVLSLAVAIQGKNNIGHLKSLYMKTVSSIQELDTISNESKKLISQALETANNNSMDDAIAQVKSLRNALEYVYNEVRLPELHSQPVFHARENGEAKLKKEEVLLDFVGSKEALCKFTPKILNDTVMGGESRSDFRIQNGDGFFQGEVSIVRDGGFASVKFHPENVEVLRNALKGCIGLTCLVKNLTKRVQRFKIQLSSLQRMRAFNYQSEIVLSPSSDFTPVFLHISTFWPSMFGHVVASQGTMDINTVDVLGIIVSKLTDDCKPNPDFEEGHFSIVLRSIKVVY